MPYKIQYLQADGGVIAIYPGMLCAGEFAQCSKESASGYSNKHKHTIAKKFYDKSESLCEDALEILEEIIRADAQLQIWFDREIEFAAGSDLGADLVSLPRVVTSRSNERQRSDVRIVSKREVKLGVVERAAERIGRDVESEKDNARDELNKFLSTDE